MQFLVIAAGVEPFSLPDAGDRPIRSNRYRAELVASGKIVLHAHIAGHRAHMWIFDVDSVDELDEVMSNDPMSGFFSGTPQIYPLISQDRMQAREKAIEELLSGS
jgi:muconolactone delta-isomerase